jgi:SAM-dependent methyltransferase
MCWFTCYRGRSALRPGTLASAPITQERRGWQRSPTGLRRQIRVPNNRLEHSLFSLHNTRECRRAGPPQSNEKPMRQLAKKLSMQVITANAHPSELGDSGIEVRPLGLRVVSVLDPIEEVLRQSGIARGMRVLDLECGTGNASLSIAKLIGPSGLVVGVDRSAEAIDVAEKRATVAGYCYWTRFVAADPNTYVPPERFDAVVVRSTLLRRGERATLPRLSACVRPGGVVVSVFGKPAAK